jgi:hypothetical protein
MLAEAIATVVYLVGRILGRMAFSPLLAILALVSFPNLVALLIVAFVD